MKWPWEARRDAADRELDDEIRAHMAMAIADRIARGESPDDAAYAVRREFGNVGHVKELTREAWGSIWLERLMQDLRYAVRSLLRAPVFSLVAILTLALGIGANTAMFTVVRGIILRPLPFRDPDALFLVRHAPDRLVTFVGPSMVDAEYIDYRRQTKTFATTTSYNTYPATLLGAGEPARVATAGATPSFFTTLGVKPLIGRTFREGDEAPGARNIAVIGEQLWRERFGGDTAVLGRSVTIDGYRQTIVGVMPAGFEFPQHTRIWLPIPIEREGHNYRFRPVIGRLAANATPSQALAELRAFAENAERANGNRDHSSVAVLPLQDVVVGNVKTSLFIFAGAVGIVLLIACANVSNLTLMRAATRGHELGIRAALGAGRWRLVRQMLLECLIIALVGGIIGLALARAGVALVLAAAPADLLPRTSEVHLDLVVLTVTLLTCVVAGALSGTAPAIAASKRDVRELLGAAGRVTSRSRLRSLFVTAEATLALLLLISAGLLLRTFERLRSVDLGFAPGHLMTATLDFQPTQYQTTASLQDVQQRIAARIAAIPGVRVSGAVNWLPLTQTTIMGDFTVEDRRPMPPNYIVLKPGVTPEYFAVMGIRIRQGRGFMPSDNASSPAVVVLSQSVADRLWAGENPIGKRITMADKPTPADWMTIVGVVDDVVQEGVAGSKAQAIYQSLAQMKKSFWIEHINFVVRTDGASDARVAQGIRAAIRSVDPDQPIEQIMTMESRLGVVVAEPRFRSLVLTVFSALALTLAAIGIYGVLAYGVTERTRELGIRIALGATRGGITRLVLANGAALALPGLLVGLAASFVATRILSSVLFHVQPMDPATVIGASVLLLAVALGAAYIPARRASRIDLLIAMK